MIPPPFPCPRGTPARVRRRGFTLVEMLAVMGVVAVLLALIVPSLRGLNSGNLNNAGRLFTNLLAIARSEAIQRRTIVRVEIATQWPADPALRYRKITLTAANLVPARGSYVYQQIAGWETLPNGVVFDPADPQPGAADSSLYFLDPTLSNSTTAATSAISFAGATIPTVYFAYAPDGTLNEPNNPATPVRARLTEGILPTGSNSVTYTRQTNGTGSANWFDVRINPLVGRTEIGRPESPLSFAP